MTFPICSQAIPLSCYPGYTNETDEAHIVAQNFSQFDFSTRLAFLTAVTRTEKQEEERGKRVTRSRVYAVRDGVEAGGGTISHLETWPAKRAESGWIRV